MKTNKLWNIIVLLTLAFCNLFVLSSCDSTEDGKKTEVSIVGRWVAIFSEEGDTFIMNFKENGTGYGCEGWKEERVMNKQEYQFSYVINDGKINLYGNNSEWNGMKLDYTLSQDGKNLTIYGIDDNDLSVLHFTKNNTPDTTGQNTKEDPCEPIFHVMDKSEMNGKGVYVSDPLSGKELYGKYFYSFQFGFGIDENAYRDGITKIVAHLKIDSGYLKIANKPNAANIDIQLDIKEPKQTNFWDAFAAVSTKSSVTISYSFDYYKGNVRYTIPVSDSYTIISE